MNTDRVRFLIDFGKQIGFAVSILSAFLLGVFWTRSQSDKVAAAVPEAPETSRLGNQSRFAASKIEPEDFYPVAEFRQQSAIVIGCYSFLKTDPQLFMDIAKEIDGRLPLFGLVGSEGEALAGMDAIREAGLPTDAMHFLPLPANTIWIRDYAPFMIRRYDNSVGMIDAKYQNRLEPNLRKREEEMAGALAEMMGLPLRSIPLILEGGNFLSNADGTVITSSGTIGINQGYDFTEKQIGAMFRDYFGIRNWALVPALAGEPTGHVDMFLTFLAKNIIVVCAADPKTDPVNAKLLDDVATHLSRENTSIGPLQVHRVPMPSKWNENWRSYTNIILANGILLMPSYSDVDPELEQRAADVYQSLLPGWQVKKVNCDALVRLQGQLHCISYNVPRYVSIEGLLDRSTARAEFARSKRSEENLPELPDVSATKSTRLGL